MSQLDDLRRRYAELGEEIAKLEKQPKVPPKGWPVIILSGCGDVPLIRISTGIDGFRKGSIRVYQFGHFDDRRGIATYPEGLWKYHTLPDGRELSPENFKGGHSVKIRCTEREGYHMSIDDFGHFPVDQFTAVRLLGDKFDTIGNEWVEV